MSVPAPNMKTFVCCLPPAGTPDPSIAPDLEGKKSRPRIYLPAQEDGGCLFAAADRIRLIMGQHPSVANTPLRKAEEKVEVVRKAFGALASNTTWKLTFADQFLQEFKQGDRQTAKEFIESNKKNSKLGNPEILTVLQEFLDQDEFGDLRVFVGVEFTQQAIQLTKQLMTSFLTPDLAPKGEQLVDQLIEKYQSSGLSQEDAANAAKGFGHKLIFKALQLSESTWHP